MNGRATTTGAVLAALYTLCCVAPVWCAGVGEHGTAAVAPNDTSPAGSHDTSVMAARDAAIVTPHNPQPTFVTLVGDLPKALSAEKGPYLVTSDIYVPAGKTVSVQAGTVFLFKNFTGLHVQGTLAIKGSAEKPVIFTSENDRRFNPAASLNPNPYDWNGIFIHDDAIGTDLQNFEIGYSVYGINSLTKFIRIASGVFHDNGRANLTIEGLPQTVTAAGGPFSYSLSVKNASVDGVPVKILSDPEAVKRNTLRIGGLAVFLTSCALDAIFAIQTNSWQKQMNVISKDLYSYEKTDFVNAQAGRNKNIAGVAVTSTLALIGAAGFSLSFRY